jgi:hypothetical protein
LDRQDLGEQGAKGTPASLVGGYSLLGWPVPDGGGVGESHDPGHQEQRRSTFNLALPPSYLKITWIVNNKETEMRTRITIILALALVLVLGSSVGVFAAFQPTIVLNPIGPLTYTSFPQTYNVTGTATYTTVLQELQLQINGVLHGAKLGTLTPGQDPSPYSFSFPWTITAPGTYEIKVWGRHGNEDAYGEEVVVVSGTVVIVDCPAAPAVANRLLREHNPTLRPNSVTFTNIISAVAHHMGDQYGRGTDFEWGGIYYSKCDTGNYAWAIKMFMLSLLESHP